jgi:hypothetical protein
LNKIYENEKYDLSSESRIKFAGTDEKIFGIKEWEVFQL